MRATLTLLAALLLAPLAALHGAEIDLRPQWHETIPLENPHKGWYHHYYDNHIELDNNRFYTIAPVPIR